MIRSEKIQSIEVGRGVAATVVLLAHATGFTTVGGGNAFHGLFGFGNVGVDFFFALSGFIMLHVHKKDLGQPQRLARYAWRRFVRIYPIYIVLTLGSLVLIALLPFYRADIKISAGYLICNFLLIPYGPDFHYPIMSPAWSLSNEVVFYIIFGVAIIHRRIGMALMGAWLIAVGFAQAFTFDVSGGVRFALFYWANILFAFGLTAAIVAPKINRGGLVIFMIGLCILVPACLAYSFELPPMTNVTARRLIYGVASGLIITGLVVWERKNKFSFPRWAVTWGAASYAIYLVHYPVLELLSHARIRLGLIPWIHDELYLIVQLAVGVCCGLLVHWYIEKPITSWVKGSDLHLRLDRRQASAAAAS